MIEMYKPKRNFNYPVKMIISMVDVLIRWAEGSKGAGSGVAWPKDYYAQHFGGRFRTLSYLCWNSYMIN